MTQRIFGLGIGGTGIVAVLIIAGIFLNGSQINVSAGQVAIWGGVAIGLIFGALGVVGIVSRYV
jgi:hypothetical protein